MNDSSDDMKIHIDDDWKSEAQAEKKRLEEESKKAPEADGTGERGMPEASFETLVSTMATQAMFAMGVIPDPRTGQRVQHLDLARHHIDMLTVIDEKTRGNLSEEETKLLSQTLYELRNNYIALSTATRNR